MTRVMTRDEIVEAMISAEEIGDIETAEIYQTMLNQMDGLND